MSTTFRLAELTGVAPGRYRLDTAAGSASPAADLSLTEPLLLLRQGQLPAPVKSSTGRPVLYAKRLGLGDRVLATVMLAADSQAPAGAPGGTGGATLQALADLDAAKAPLASPAFTGTPTAPTAAAGTNTTQVATTAFTRGEVAALVASAPGTLDTLGEIAAALASDESAATALATTVAGKAPLASPVFTGNPTAPTPTAGDNDTSIATTAFVKTAVGSSIASFLPETFGAVGDGTTDDTAAILAADTAAAAVGGVVVFQAKTYLALGCLAPAYTGPSNAPVQKPRRWTGQGGSTSNGYWASAPINGGTVLDLRYDGTDTLHPAKIDTRGAGFLEVDHITFKSGGTDDFPFFQTTNTTVHIHHNAFIGNTAKTGTACVQDAIIAGGSTTSGTIGSLATSPFQGYGTRVHDNYFGHIRRGFVGQAYCNQIPVENNTFSTSCGSSTGGAIEWHGKSGEPCTGATTRGNTIEVANYKYGIALYDAEQFNLGPDGFYDPTATHLGAIYIDSTARYGLVTDGMHNDTYPLCLDAANTTTVITAHQSQPSIYAQPSMFTHSYAPAVRNGQSVGVSAFSPRGDQAMIQSLDASYGPGVVLAQIAATAVADGVTTSGSNVVTSATAAWTATDVGMPISGTGIPTGAFILGRDSATQVRISANATATATGVALKFGRRGGTPVSQLMMLKTHIWGQGNTPTAVVGAGAGTGATIAVAGSDTAMQITLTTGTGPASGTLATVTWASTWSLSPVLGVAAKNALTAAGLGSIYFAATSSSMTISAASALTASSSYVLDVLSMGRP